MKKVLFLLIFSLVTGANAIDFSKTCEISSRVVSPYYSTYYDDYVNLFNKTSPKTRERNKGIQIMDEKMEQFLDALSIKLNSLESSEKFAVMSVYKYSMIKMDRIATDDALSERGKQPKERIERLIFTDCVSSISR